MGRAKCFSLTYGRVPLSTRPVRSQDPEAQGQVRSRVSRPSAHAEARAIGAVAPDRGDIEPEKSWFMLSGGAQKAPLKPKLPVR